MGTLTKILQHVHFEFFTVTNGLLLIKICYTATCLVTLNFILVIWGVIDIPLHEMEAHYVPILSSSKAAGAVTETTSSTSLAPARVSQGSWFGVP